MACARTIGRLQVPDTTFRSFEPRDDTDLFAYTRPDPDGKHGGKPLDQNLNPCDDSRSYTSEFHRIQEWVDKIVDRWRNLPSEADIRNWKQRFDRVVSRFEHGQPLILDIGETRRILCLDDGAGMSGESEGLRGSAILAFKEYINQLEKAVYACGTVARLVDASLDAEAKVWNQATYASTQAIHRMAGVCKRLAETGGSTSAGVKDLLNAVGLGLGFASVIPSPIQGEIGLSSLALSAVTTAGSYGSSTFKAGEYLNPPRPDIPHYHGAIEVLSLLLNGSKNSVDESVKIAEEEIRRCLSAAHHAMTVEVVRLFSPKVGPVTEIPETLRHNRDLALEVVERTARVSVELCSAAADLDTFRDEGAPSIMKRHSRIGVGYGTGPYYMLDTLVMFLGLALQELGNEAYAAAANLHAVVEALDIAESERHEFIQATANGFSSANTDYVSYYSNEANIPLGVPIVTPKPVIPDIDQMTRDPK